MLDYDITYSAHDGGYYAEIFNAVTGRTYGYTDSYATEAEAVEAAERAIEHNGFTVAPAE